MLSLIDKKLISLLGKGEENGIKKDVLSKELGISKRDVRARIHNLRVEGYPIISNTGVGGYYFAANRKELKNFVSDHQSRIDRLKEVIEGVNEHREELDMNWDEC